MLVLRRKAGEAIVLNGSITIHMLAVEGERVKLGISAPPEVVIVRSELLDNQGQAQLPSSGAVASAHHETPRPYRAEDGPRAGEALQGASTPGEDADLYREPVRYPARRQAFGQTGPAPAPIGHAPIRYR